MRNHRIVALLVGLCLSIAGCSDSSRTSPTSPSPAPAPGLSLAGAWTGTLNLGGQEDDVIGLTWTAAQNGTSVSGPMVLRIDDEGDQPFTINGTLSGTVSGAQLTSTRFTIAAGAIPDPELTMCSISGTGTQAATATSISGSLAMVFAPNALPCVGPDAAINDTPTATWQLSLRK